MTQATQREELNFGDTVYIVGFGDANPMTVVKVHPRAVDCTFKANGTDFYQTHLRRNVSKTPTTQEQSQ